MLRPERIDSTHPVLAKSACAQCGAALIGPYCHECGEERVSATDLTLRPVLVRTFLLAPRHFLSRLALTFHALLLAPGSLSVEYCLGRRRRFLGPVLLLSLSLAVFTLATPHIGRLWIPYEQTRFGIITPPLPEAFSARNLTSRADWTGWGEGALERVNRRKLIDTPEYQNAFNQNVRLSTQVLSWASLAWIAALLWTVFHKRRSYFCENALFTVHLAAFVLISSALIPLCYGAFLDPQTDSVSPVGRSILLMGLFGLQIAYLYRALVRFYSSSLLRAALVTAFLLAVNLIWAQIVYNSAIVFAILAS